MAYLSTLFRYSKNIKNFSSKALTNASILRQRNSSSLDASPVLKIEGISDDGSNGALQVQWSDGVVSNFPHIFLRNSCQCPECVHPSTKERMFDTFKHIDINIRAKQVRHEIDCDAVFVRWPDNHGSTYRASWLRERKFPESWCDTHASTFYGIRAQQWKSCEMLENLPFIDYEELISTDDKVLLNHHENLFVHGLSIIKGAPAKRGVLYELVNRVSHGHTRRVHCGEFFTVEVKPSPNNLSYTSGSLPLHVDLPWYSHQPDVQYLHCIEQSTGKRSGVSLLTDGFRAVEKLKITNPDFFELLTKVKFTFTFIGWETSGDVHLETERPVIGLDLYGNVERVSISNHGWTAVNAPWEMVHDCYRAYYALQELLYNDVLQYKMSPGDILCFNNNRVLHGRSSYDATKTTRLIEGCYVGWDELRSKYRVIREGVTKKSRDC